MHGPIEAALALRRAVGFAAEDFEDVLVVYTTGGFNITCEPEAERRVPVSVQHAKFSLYYNVACALARGHLSLEDFTPDAVSDPRVRGLAARVRVTVDPALTRVIPPGIVTVRLRDGREFHERVDDLKGTPENPVSFEACAAKLRSCAKIAARPLAGHAVEGVIERVARIETLPDVTPLVALLV